jgi:NIMA (never in mitosis gene a)-related kinase
MRSKNSAFPEFLINDWFRQICSALSYLKSKKIVHRDLKPLNIFLSDNQIKIGDFGISKVLVKDYTDTKILVGTYRYIAPELLERKPYNTKSDLWAVGCIIYELCTLKKAFDGDSHFDIIDKIVAGQYDPIAEDRPYSVKLRKIVDLLLQKD